MSTTPPGWYPRPDMPGTQGYWDGARWTQHTAPVPAPAPTGSHAGLAAVLIILGMLGLAGGVLMLVAGETLGVILLAVGLIFAAVGFGASRT